MPHLSPHRTAASRLVPPLLLFLTSWNPPELKPDAAECAGAAWWWWKQRNDSSFWHLDPAVVRQRRRDEAQAQALLMSIQQHIAAQPRRSGNAASSATNASPPVIENDITELQKLQQEWLQVVFGAGITSIAQRQIFVEEYGCTGWTDEVVSLLLDVAGDRGIVELGAGNGQWARRLTEAYQERKQNRGGSSRRDDKFDFVLAYDDRSALPMPAQKTQRNDMVRPLLGNSVAATIRQWQCRHRVLLLVFPPPDSDMAYEAVQAYDEVHSQSTNTNTVSAPAIVYVGEGKGGVNANAAFFDYLRDHGWYVHTVLPVHSFGTKGKEQLYLLLRRP
jgi:hypothetical protein